MRWPLCSIALATCLAVAGCAPARCQPGEGATGSPRSIDDVLTLARSLGPDADVECFVESLERPLRMEATASVISLQPAVGARSPRVFVFYEPLVLSFAVDGDGRNLVEMGELVDAGRSIKGEFALPAEGPLDAEAPFDHLLFQEDPPLTTCGVCHRNEQNVGDDTDARVSAAYRPADRSLVPVERLAEERRVCDDGAEPERCAMLRALVDHGPIVHQAFSDDFELF